MTTRRRIFWAMTTVTVIAGWPMFGQEVSTKSSDGVLRSETRYTWRDGDKIRVVWVAQDLVVLDGKTVRKDVPPDGVASVRSAASESHPVFVRESGEIATLPGGVVLVLDRSWGAPEVEAFLARVNVSGIRPLALTNGFLIPTEPGLPSLELALICRNNALV